MVLIHGVGGTAQDLEQLEAILRIQNTIILRPECNHGQTYDGIKKGSNRLYLSIKGAIEKLKPNYFSIVGHGIGGLYARVVVKKLHLFGLFSNLVPLYFINVETPQTGSKGWLRGMLADLILEQTDKDLMNISTAKKGSVLQRMTGQKYLEALGKFKNLILYSSIRGDSPYKAESTSIKSSSHGKSMEINGYTTLVTESEFGSSSIDSVVSKTGHSMMDTLGQLDWKRFYYTGYMLHNPKFWNTELSNELMQHMSSMVRNEFKLQFPETNHEYHLVVLIHGLEGFNTDLKYISNKLRQRFPGVLKTLAPDCNHGRTFDGIMNGANRILELVEREIAGGAVKYISFIGHSLGGLYARCVVGLLHQKGMIPSLVIPVNFITLATPHLGSREHSKVLGQRFTGLLVGTVVGQTGKG